MKRLNRTFLTGLAAILPVTATIYVLYQLAITAETFLGKGLRLLLPAHFYLPGMGVLTGLIIVFFAGLLLHAWMVRTLFEWGEGLLYKIPFVKSVYGAFRDFLKFVSESGERSGRGSQVVMIKIGNSEMEMMGLVTRRDFTNLPGGIGSGEHVAVYLPMSYQLGGHTVILPKSCLRPVEVSPEEAMRFILTAGMMARPHSPKENASKIMRI